MGKKEQMVETVCKWMSDRVNVRNICIAAHVDHGKTTLSDSLLAGAGLISKQLAGTQLVLDFEDQEQERGITINASNISMFYNFEGTPHVVNLIDTPGHVDFGGEVTRAMRAVDGAIVVCCAVEQIMPQTETVLRQALKEKVRPVLFINKVDRLIRELKVSPEEMQARFTKIINKVNEIIAKVAPEEYKTEWQVSVNNGSVAFGSAIGKWGISYPVMQKTKVSFTDIYNKCKAGDDADLQERIPLCSAILDMVITHLPNPITAQKYRVPHLWHGDLQSDVAKSMINCDPNGPVVMIVHDISVDEYGEVATGRLLSGTVKAGDELFCVTEKAKDRVQQVQIFMGVDRFNVPEISAGNIAALVGIKHAITGETVNGGPEPIVPFEQLKHYSEAVVTKAIEPVHTEDLTKLIDELKSLAKDDWTLKIKIDEETGEYLMSGMGELHLETKEHRIRKKGIEIKTSPPIVVYRETVASTSPEYEGKSPNKHNKFKFVAAPLEDYVIKAIREGDIPEGRVKDPKALGLKLRDMGFDYDQGKNIKMVYGNNLFIDMTKGIQHLNETLDLVFDSFMGVIDKGPLAGEKVDGVKFILTDATLHEDAVHRGPAQIYPAVRGPLYACLLSAGITLLEPRQRILINVPEEYMGNVITEVQGRRGQVNDMTHEGDMVAVDSEAPVAELFGFAAGIRSASQGKALWCPEFRGFQKLPRDLLETVVTQIRKRKGLPPEVPGPSHYVG